MNLPMQTAMELMVEDPELLESIRALPTEDELPCDDGEPMETPQHRDQMMLLIQSLKLHWADRRGYYIGGNMFLHFDPDNPRRFRGPDFFLALDVAERERKSWVVWYEGMRFPDVIIELLSDSTRNIDKGEKKVLYERVFRTQEYYLYDPFSQEFFGYHLHRLRYRRRRPDAEQKIYSPVTDLYLAVRDGHLRWQTEAGVVLPTPEEHAERTERRFERERLRAEQAQQQAEQAQQQAEQERLRAEQAEAILEEYRRRFGSL